MKKEHWEPQRVAASPDGVISTAHHLATQAGAQMLNEGGNAFDAAVAAALALCVCEPQACGLGGQTMAIFHRPTRRRTVALDGSSRAPSRAMNEAFTSKAEKLRGHRATTVPSTPAVMDYLARTYGTLPLSRLLEPAVQLASEGFPISALQRRLIAREHQHLLERPSGKVFLRGGHVPDEGWLLVQPALAETLRRVAKLGVDDFYLGEIASEIERDMIDGGGLIRRDDLGHVPRPIERRPISCRFEDLRVLTFPPAGAGRTLVQMLHILSNFPQKSRDPDSLRGAVLLAETIRRAELDRRDRPFDPNFYPQVDDRKVVSEEYGKLVAKQIRARIRPAKTADALGPTDGRGATAGDPMRGETTHLSVIDKWGNMVGVTQSIERVFGSFAMSPHLGFIYNNYMSAFEYRDFTHPYYLRPNGVPWASVAPTIVFRGRRPWLVIGSPGSERITSAILQVVLRAQTQTLFGAVVAPRMHCSAAGRVSLEASWMRDDIPKALENLGFTVDVREAQSFYLGCVQAVAREDKTVIGVADPRRDGSAVGARL